MSKGEDIDSSSRCMSRDAAYNIKLEWRLIGILKNGFPL
jgi:hypothetical protein